MIVEPAAAAQTTASRARAGGDDLRRATLGFERVLLAQLLQPLADAAGEQAPPAYKELLPQALADAVAEGGGIGLADDLQRALTERLP